MKRLLAAVIAVAALLCACSKAAELSPGAVLLSEGGDALIYTEDYEYAALYEELYAARYGGKALKGDGLFTALAETALLTRLAELYGSSADAEAVRADYELLISDPATEDAAFLAELKQRSGLKDGEFADMYIRRAYMSESASLLVKEIASEYGNLPDGEAIREAVLNNIYEMVSHLSITVSYPGAEGQAFGFDIVDAL